MTVVVEGHLRIRATRTGQDTLAATLMALMQSAPTTDTRVSNHARKVGNWAVVPTLATGAAVWVTSGSVARVAGIVSLDLGTGMRVSAPIAIVSAQTHAARRGILIRHGRALEILAHVDTIVFDKTGTLTGAWPRRRYPGARRRHRPHDVLRLAASAEQARTIRSPRQSPATRWSTIFSSRPAPPGTTSLVRGWWRRSMGRPSTSAAAS